ncbi:hypothetical protein BHE74_00029031 [Ensete ventricosum]|nr:hypothetical protein BHE74_00029031 [Ensete ventricosum]
MSAVAMPYTGGDVKRSGELGKMFDIPTDKSRSRKSGPITSTPAKTETFGRAASFSGPIVPNLGNRSNHSSGPVSSTGVTGTGSSNRLKSNSGPLNKQNDSMKKSSGQQSGGANLMAGQSSGPLPLRATGLITSGPVSSGPLNSSGAPRKVPGPLDFAGSAKIHIPSTVHKQAITTIIREDKSSSKSNISKPLFLELLDEKPVRCALFSSPHVRRRSYPQSAKKPASDKSGLGEQHRISRFFLFFSLSFFLPRLIPPEIS